VFVWNNKPPRAAQSPDDKTSWKAALDRKIALNSGGKQGKLASGFVFLVF
jgi:hypothetical protein